MNRAEFVKLAESYLGRPYVWGGNGPTEVDCSGYIFSVYNASGNVRADTTAQGLYNRTTPVNSPRLGDLAFLHSSGYISHVGLVIDSDTIIEARGRAYGVVKTPLAKFKTRNGYTWKGVRRDPNFVLNDDLPLAESVRLWAGFAAQQNQRFGGKFASNSITRARMMGTLLNASVFGITESDSVMESAILANNAVRNSVALSTRTVNVFFNTNKWTARSSRQVLHGDNYHGALCVPLVSKETGIGFDFIVNHTRPKSVATDKQKREDVRRALSLTGTWPYVLVGDFAMNADSLVPAARLSPLEDTYDPAGSQPIDAMYGRNVRKLDSKILDPGAMSDHKWIRTQLEIGA